MKKKFFLLGLFMLMICTAFTALADYQAGDVVTITVSVSNASQVCGFRIGLNYDSSAFEFIEAVGQNGVTGGTRFAYASTAPFGNRVVGTASFRVKDTAVPGHTYKISASRIDAYNTDLEPVDMGVSTSGGSVTIAAPCDHDYAEEVNVPASCTQPGESTFTCSKCGDSYTKEVPAKGHEYDAGTITKQPTCKEEGVKTFTCTVCDNKKTEKVEKLKHDYTSEVTTEATCGKDGVKTFTCSKCGDTYEEKIPATGEHTYVEEATLVPTCLNKGEKTSTCTVCGDTRKEDIPATGHQPGSDLKQQEPTCTKPGYRYFTCTKCGAEVKEDAIPATGVHIYETTKETPPTCTAAGKRVSTCTYGCGKTKTETLKALGHKMGAWVITTEPTCTGKGKETRICENEGCSKTETRSVKAKGHKMGAWVITTEPTCTEKGKQTRVCENEGCGKTETKSVKALGHDWDEWVITKPVTEEESGEKQRTCKRCDVVETRKISNLANYRMTVCTEGIRFRDLKNPITKEWYMFTPIDLSVDGVQTFNLIAGNKHKIGTATVLVQNGNVTVTYKVNNSDTINVYDEFMTILPSLADVTRLDFKNMTNYAYGEPISIEETLGGDTKVLLLLCNRVAYQEEARGVEPFKGKGEAYNALVEELKKLMD